MIQVNRLKAIGTLSPGSLIEVFERSLSSEYDRSSFLFKEVVLDACSIQVLLEACSDKSVDCLPGFLVPDHPDYILQISLSQRLIELLPAFVYCRELYGLNYRLSIFVNTVTTTLAPLDVSLPLMRRGDEIVFNTPFSRKCLTSILSVNPSIIRVSPPIPELCRLSTTVVPRRPVDSSSTKTISCFSRLHADKCIHTILEALALLPSCWHLRLYGNNTPSTVYQDHLLYLIKSLGLDRRVTLNPLLVSLDHRISQLASSDVVVNLSTSFEETMGKVILEASSWNIPVIANVWNGFPDLITREHLLPTSWDKTNWFHVCPSDLAQAITASQRPPHSTSRSIFDNFLSMRDREMKSSVHSGNEPPLAASRLPDYSLLIQWIQRPRQMSITYGPRYMLKHSRLLTLCFSHGILPRQPATSGLDETNLHPNYIHMYCQLQSLDPRQYLHDWLRRSTHSPFQEIALTMLSEHQTT